MHKEEELKLERAVALQGSFLYCRSPGELAVFEGLAVCEQGRCAGLFDSLPGRYEGIAVENHSGCLILPGMVDLHLHGPQVNNRGLGMDLELLGWLERYTYPEESRYAQIDYAEASYGLLAGELRRGFTTRACVFGSLHRPATLRLMELLEATGLVTMAGKVGMDRNAPNGLREPDAASALADAERWLEACAGRFARTIPILTPRFVPACSDELLEGMGKLAARRNLPVQSHLSENPSEIEWVARLHPDCGCYAAAYDKYKLLGPKTVMAHCVHSDATERALLKARGVMVAHCPISNTNLRSGVAPVRAMLDEGLRVGLGSDIAGGHTLSMIRVMAEAVAASKLRWRLLEDSRPPLSLTEAFYLATKGGGGFFGKVGSFEEGYEFDAVILDDRRLTGARPLDPAERLQRAVALADERDIAAKYAAGRRIDLAP